MIINLGNAPFKAYIQVTYPYGSCTCTLGGTSYSHSGGGTATFEVNKKGTWTITAENGLGLVKSAEAQVSQKEETVKVSISYTLYIYNQGTTYPELTGDWVFANNNTATNCLKSKYILVGGHGDFFAFATHSTPVNVSPYKNITFRFYVQSTYTGDGATNAAAYGSGISRGHSCPAGISNFGVVDAAAGTWLTKSLDISKYGGNAYVILGVNRAPECVVRYSYVYLS